ncbi:MAG: dTDP-glucose 4,6-dehydratase [Pseudomonadales bacterium]|nr:dTDP-glucose 4,6-dehydratase [Pseudomonadales bacterium]
MKLLITGGAGFIGSNFARYCISQSIDDFVIADALTYAGVRASLEGIDTEFYSTDITDTAAVNAIVRKHKIDCIVNFAAESHNSFAIENPTIFFQTNAMGTQSLLEVARANDIRFHHISTCEVYGDLDLDSDDMFSESSPLKPRTPYNASKAAADMATRAYFLTYNTQITISNCANNYGPYQFPEKLIPLFTTLALQDFDLPMYKSKDNLREYLHVEDHCRAILSILDKGRIGETYNIGSGFEASVEQVADQILDILGKPHSLKTIVPDRPSHDKRYLLDSSKITNELGWQPEIEFGAGLKETINWYQENTDWWQALVGRSPVKETGWGEYKSTNSSS